jgi:hypothetical protein
MNAPNKTLEPFRINISDEVLNDLSARLKATRFAPDLNNEDMSYGLLCAKSGHTTSSQEPLQPAQCANLSGRPPRYRGPLYQGK